MALLVGMAMAGSIVAAVLVPLRQAMPEYETLAEALRSGTSLDEGFLPLGYPLIGGSLRWLGTPTSFVTIGLFALWGTWAIALLAFRPNESLAVLPPRRTSWEAAYGWVWLAWLLFNPVLVIGVVTVDDNAVNILLVSILFAVAVRGRGVTPIGWVAAGLAQGAFVAVRPNSAVMVLAVLASMVLTRTGYRRAAVYAIGALVAFAGISIASAGQAIAWPDNGPYNLLAGNNPYATGALVERLNAEASLEAAGTWCATVDRASNPTACAVEFVRHEGPAYLKTVAIKAGVLLLAIDNRSEPTPVELGLRVLFALPAWSWWLWVVANGHFRRSVAGQIAMIFIAAYALPYLATNADPRFRLPIEMLMCMSVLAYLGERFGHSAWARPNQPAGDASLSLVRRDNGRHGA